MDLILELINWIFFKEILGRKKYEWGNGHKITQIIIRRIKKLFQIRDKFSSKLSKYSPVYLIIKTCFDIEFYNFKHANVKQN